MHYFFFSGKDWQNLIFYPGFVYFYSSTELVALPVITSYVNIKETVTNETSVITSVTRNKTVVITNSSGTFTYREFNGNVIKGTSTIYGSPISTSMTIYFIFNSLSCLARSWHNQNQYPAHETKMGNKHISFTLILAIKSIENDGQEKR